MASYAASGRKTGNREKSTTVARNTSGCAHVAGISVRLDQFYTKPEIAQKCWVSVRQVMEELAGGRQLFFIEPSAGDGVFYDLLPAGQRLGLDIEPQHNAIVQADFLKCRYKLPATRQQTLVLGNPPFGKRGKVAVAFVNRAFAIADTVAFIVPVIFRKYFIHKQILAPARWIHTVPLPRCAFRTARQQDYGVHTEFQIWTLLPSAHRDARLHQPPPIRHADFTMWQYNNTAQALKMFENPFDFAVPCQGYQDYSRREISAAGCEKHKQWMLFQTDSNKVLARLRDDMDYGALALKHTTTTPGFRKGDVVLEYTQKYC